MDSAGDGDGLPLKVWEGRPGDLGLRCGTKYLIVGTIGIDYA
jgi:hypothetical protein